MPAAYVSGQVHAYVTQTSCRTVSSIHEAEDGAQLISLRSNMGQNAGVELSPLQSNFREDGEEGAS